MGVKMSCSWCDYTVASTRYPRSAGFRDAKLKMKRHRQEKHPRKEKKFQQIVDIWADKLYPNNSKIGQLKKNIKYKIDRIDSSRPQRSIVDEVSIDELKNLSTNELRHLIAEHNKNN